MLQVTEDPARPGTMICAQIQILDSDTKIQCRSSSIKARMLGQKFCGHVWDAADVQEMRTLGAKGNFTLYCPIPKCKLAHVVSTIPGKPGLWIGALI